MRGAVRRAERGARSGARFVALEGAFHGETVGARASAGSRCFGAPSRASCSTASVSPSPGDADAYARAFEELGERSLEGADEIAAVVLEPLVQGAAGMRIYAAEYLRHARALCDRARDPAGLRRGLHRLRAHRPDVGVDIGGGFARHACASPRASPAGCLPMSATLVTERIFEGFLGDKSRAFYYGHTYCGNPLGAAVAREVLRDLRRREDPRARHSRRRARSPARSTRMATIRGVTAARARHDRRARSRRARRAERLPRAARAGAFTTPRVVGASTCARSATWSTSLRRSTFPTRTSTSCSAKCAKPLKRS